ncbi:MAG: response regulator [Psychromonas sp.]
MANLNILIVDDNYEKIQQLQSIIKRENIKLDCVLSSQDAKIKMVEKQYDLLLLDIQIPNELGDPINAQGGIELLNWIGIYPSCFQPKRIIGLTSHDSTKSEFEQLFISKGHHLLKTTIGDDIWLQTIISTCEYLEKQTEEVLKFDVGIITAMSHNELKAILNLPVTWVEFVLEEDPSTYHKGEITTSTGKKSIVISHSPRMGLSAAAALTSKMCVKFNPKYMIMAGIAAGVRKKVNLGDILVADPCWDWGNGKLTEENGLPLFQAAPHQENLPMNIRSKIQKIRDNDLYVDEIRKGWQGNSQKELSIKLGPIASGAVVLEDPQTAISITSQHRETIGIEMEAYGVMAATSISSTQTKAIIIKSVCDYADPEKNDNWQEYACYTSAQFVYHFIKNDLFS